MGLVGSRSQGMGSVGSGTWILVHKSTTWPAISGEGLSAWSRCGAACCGAHRRAALPHFLLFQPQSKSWHPATPGHLALLAFGVLPYLQWGGPKCCISATPLQTWPPEVDHIHPKTSSVVPKSSRRALALWSHGKQLPLGAGTGWPRDSTLASQAVGPASPCSPVTSRMPHASALSPEPDDDHCLWGATLGLWGQASSKRPLTPGGGLDPPLLRGVGLCGREILGVIAEGRLSGGMVWWGAAHKMVISILGDEGAWHS